jgi:hypothetical protein
VTETLTSGGSASVNFSATAGQIINFYGENGTFPSNSDLSATGYPPGLPRSMGDGPFGAGQSFAVGPYRLPRSGIYTVDLQAEPGTSGSTTLYVTADQTGGILTANSSSGTTFTAAAPGQGAVYTFNGTAGEVVSLDAENGTYATNDDLEVLIAPSNPPFGTPGFEPLAYFPGGQSGDSGQVRLPSTGTYSVYLNLGYNVFYAGSVTLYLAT